MCCCLPVHPCSPQPASAQQSRGVCQGAGDRHPTRAAAPDPSQDNSQCCPPQCSEPFCTRETLRLPTGIPHSYAETAQLGLRNLCLLSTHNGDVLSNSSGDCMCKFIAAHWQETNASHSPTAYWYIVLCLSIKISLMQTKN